jgi:enterobacterial common antigen flippase
MSPALERLRQRTDPVPSRAAPRASAHVVLAVPAAAASSTTEAAPITEVEPVATGRRTNGPGRSVAGVSEVKRADPIVRTSISYWFAAAVALVLGLLRTKVTAVAVGPHGLGIISQLNNVALVLGAVSVLGVPVFGARALAHARARQDRVGERSVMRFILTAPLLCAVVLVALAMLCRQQIGSVVVGSQAYSLGLLLALLSVPFNIGFTALQTLQQGRDNASRFNRTVIVAAVVNLLIVVPLVLLGGFRGAELAIAATSIVLFAVAARAAPGDLRHISPRRLRLGSSERSLLRAGAAIVVLGTLLLAVEIALRSRLGSLHGFAAVGLYQPASLLSTQLFLQFVLGITLFLTTKLSASFAVGDDRAVRSTISAALRLALLVGAPLMLLCLGGRSLVVAILFTARFHGGQQAIALQMPGEFLRMISFVLGTVLVSAGRVRSWVAVSLLPLLLQIGLGWLLIPRVGLDALPVSFTVSYGMTTATVLLVTGRVPALRAGRREIRLMFALALIFAIALASTAISSALPAIFVCAVAVAIPLLCSTHTERRIVRDRLMRAIRGTTRPRIRVRGV